MRVSGLSGILPFIVVLAAMAVYQSRLSEPPGSMLANSNIHGAGAVPDSCQVVQAQVGCTTGTLPPTNVLCPVKGGLCTGVAYCNGTPHYDRCQPSWGWGSCTEWGNAACFKTTYRCSTWLTCVDEGDTTSDPACGTTFQCE